MRLLESRRGLRGKGTWPGWSEFWGKRAQGTPVVSSALAAGRGAKGRWASRWFCLAVAGEYRRVPPSRAHSLYILHVEGTARAAGQIRRYHAAPPRALSLPDGTRTVPAPECANTRLHRLGPLFVISRQVSWLYLDPLVPLRPCR